MPTSLILDYLAIRLKHLDAAELTGTTLLVLTDVDERHLLELSNGVLHNRPVAADDDVAADATVTTTRAGSTTCSRSRRPGRRADRWRRIEVAGDPTALLAVFGLLDDFPFWFEIVRP
jgi:alkyl sulfatase BDS1-like metallo-beta-lactamase superfamily hydrolase